jgi:hypothetical protein
MTTIKIIKTTAVALAAATSITAWASAAPKSGPYCHKECARDPDGRFCVLICDGVSSPRGGVDTISSAVAKPHESLRPGPSTGSSTSSGHHRP